MSMFFVGHKPMFLLCIHLGAKMLDSKVSAGKLSEIPPKELRLSQRLHLSTILALDHQECLVLSFFSPDFKPQWSLLLVKYCLSQLWLFAGCRVAWVPSILCGSGENLPIHSSLLPLAGNPGHPFRTIDRLFPRRFILSLYPISTLPKHSFSVPCALLQKTKSPGWKQNKKEMKEKSTDTSHVDFNLYNLPIL